MSPPVEDDLLADVVLQIEELSCPGMLKELSSLILVHFTK